MLDKAIKSGKEHRQEFVFERKATRAKYVDHSCRNHGSCTYCQNNRQFFDRKRRASADEQLKEYREY